MSACYQQERPIWSHACPAGELFEFAGRYEQGWVCVGCCQAPFWPLWRCESDFLPAAWPHVGPWPNLCSQCPYEPWGVYERMRLRVGERCESEVLRQLQEIYLDLTPWPSPNNPVLLARRWPHLCRSGP